MLPRYAELHCLSNFSFQRGASHPQELILQAQALGYEALALTDECSLAGIVRAHKALCDAQDSTESRSAPHNRIKLIIGSEITLSDGLKLVFLVPDRDGYGDLSELITLGRRQAEKGQYCLTRDDLVRQVPRCLVLWLPPAQPDPADAHWLAGIFPGRTWLAVELLRGPDDPARLASLQSLSHQSGLPLVAAGDVHMHLRSRRPLQDAITAVRLGQPVASCGFALFPNGERHLRTRQVLANLYPADLLAETVRIADQCHFSLKELQYEYPREVTPNGHTPTSYLRTLTSAGLKLRYPNTTPPAKVTEQLAMELALIERLHYEAYFLTVYDIVQWAKSQRILCQGRGSAANSVVCYLLGITEADPEITTMLFERFVSEQRGEPPDIDVDFEHQRREEVMQYIYRKYGRDRAAITATVITYRLRSALRDMGHVLGIDEAAIERGVRLLAWWDGHEDLKLRMQAAGFDVESHQIRCWLWLTTELHGFPRHLSQHVGGFIIARDRLSRLVPVENAVMADRTVIEWDKDDLDVVGLMKVDVLALGMLTALQRTLALVTARRGYPFALKDIPRMDAAVYEMIQQADTIGVFQIESRAQMSMLPRLKPAEFYDLVIEVALVRPGPIQGGMVHPYLRRRAGLEKPDYPGDDTKLAPILEKTLGVPIFQEQVMKLAQVAAGFTASEADELRRAMASWRRTGKMAHYEEKLKTGLACNGYTTEFADQIFNQIKGFSEYGFPEAHAASFALLAYFSAWLKHHEHGAFSCALLNSQPMGFYSPSQLIQDAQRHGIEVRSIDITCSDWDCTLEPTTGPQPAIRLGLRLVKGLSSDMGMQIMQLRSQMPIRDLNDLSRHGLLPPAALHALAAADSLVPITGHRRDAFWAVLGYEVPTDLLDVSPSGIAPVLSAPDEHEQVSDDYQSTGLSLRRHPLALIRPQLTRHRLYQADQLPQCRHGQLVRVAGLVTGRQRPGGAKGVLFVTLEDETGHINIIVWPKWVQRFRQALLDARLLVVYGAIQAKEGVLHVLAQYVVDESHYLGDLNLRSRDFH